MTTRHPVSVAVCSRDRPEDLEQCLVAVRAATEPTDELIVVDSASQDGRTGDVARAAGATVARLDAPGLSRARNAALHAASYDVLLFTDDDCRPEPGWATAMAAAFDEGVGFVTGMVVGEGGGQPVAVRLDPEPRTFGIGDPLDDMGHGANLAVRVRAALDAGGFDPDLGAGATFRAGEDVDLYRRLLAAGWTGRYEPTAVVSHRQWRSRGQAVAAARGYGVGWGAVAAKASAEQQARPTGRSMLRHGLGHAGLAHAWRDLRSGYPFGTAVCLAWTTGVVEGAVRGRRRWGRPAR